MELTPYIDTVRTGVVNAASLADDHTRHVAERLGGAIDSATRLALIQALSDAAGTISAELAPSSVELRMVGQDPQFAVTVHQTESAPVYLMPEAEPGATDDPVADSDDEPAARITLRLPQSVKNKIDELAAADGISTNAWLVGALTDVLAHRGPGDWPQPPVPPMPPSPGLIFGPNGPFGPHGVFGPHGPFGEGGLFGGKPGKRPHQTGPHPERGNVQGWVR